MKPEIVKISEDIPIDDNSSISHKQARELFEDNSSQHGYVTVIKNKGKWNEKLIQRDVLNLTTLGGRDFLHNQFYTNVAAGTKGGNAIAVSAEATDPVNTDTTLVGEIVAGGLTRTQASTITHVVGTNVTTLAHTFTATAIHTAVHKSALFNQNTIGGQITHAREFSADVTLQIGDTLTVTWTGTLG